MKDLAHTPVLVAEVLEALNIKADGVYFDATFGRGGHSAALLQRLGPLGRVVAIDRDPEAVRSAERHFADEPRLVMRSARFDESGEVVRNVLGARTGLDGAIADLGVSSPQLDDPRRGFSFNAAGPVDMRMDPAAPLSAAEWLAEVEERDLARVLREYGEERYARRIAHAIVSARGTPALESTTALAELIAAAVPKRERSKHPATRTFQAVRMKVNDELGQLRALLEQVLRLLNAGGRFVVISFHSLEDRIVKRFFRHHARGDDLPAELPVTRDALHPTLRLIGKAQRPGPVEVARNPRARSAIMRVAERTGEAYA